MTPADLTPLLEESIAPRPPATAELRLGIADFTYADLYRPERLATLAEMFYLALEDEDGELAGAFSRYREDRGVGWSERDESNLLVRVAPHLGAFVARLFGVEREREASMSRAQA